MKTALTILLTLLAGVAHAGNCKQFFVQPVQQVVYPQAYYAVGQDLQLEALAERIALRVEQKLALRASVKQAVTEPQTQPLPAQSALAQNCAKCHSGPTPKGNVRYDGGLLTCHDITRALRAIASNKMPKGHVIDGAVKGRLMQELLDLERPSGPAPELPPNPDLE